MSILSELLSSRSRAAVFSALFGLDDAECHLRELERRSGLSIGTIRQETARLERLGLILKRKNGNRTYLEANRDHPLFRTIHELVLKTSGLVDVLRESITPEDIEYAFVFGSVANGTDGPESDIDLMVIGNISLRQLTGMLQSAGDFLGREINPHVMRLPEYRKRLNSADGFITRVADSMKIMIIGDADELAGLAE